MNIKENKGMGYIQVVIIILFVALLAAGTTYYIRMRINIEYNETIKTNMLLIEWKAKDLKDQKTAAKEEFEAIGTKLLEIQDNSLILEFQNKNIIEESEYEKYYVLKNEDLANLSLEFANEEEAYYLINYETMEIIFSKGCVYSEEKVLYKLSDMEKEN